MNNSPEEKNLFDDLPEVSDNATDMKKPELLEQPPLGDDKTDWSDFELIEELVGSEAAWKIAEAFAGSTIYISKNILTNRTYHDIRKKFRSGSSYRELSGEYGYTETHIRNIIHKK